MNKPPLVLAKPEEEAGGGNGGGGSGGIGSNDNKGPPRHRQGFEEDAERQHSIIYELSHNLYGS